MFSDLDLIPSKVLASLLRPDMWLWIGLVTAFFTGWRGWRKITTWIVFSMVAAVSLVGFFPVGMVWVGPLERQFPPLADIENPPAAIVILGGGEDIRPSAAWGTFNIGGSGDRILHGVRRGHQFPDTPILFTGGAFNPTSDPLLEGSAERVREMMLASGLPSEQVFIGSLARTTAEHPLDIIAFLEAQNIDPTEDQPLLLITSAFHMPRSMGVMCNEDLGPVVADPTDFKTVPGQRWQDAVRWDYAGHLNLLQIGIREWVGLLAYQRAGHIAQLAPEPCSDG